MSFLISVYTFFYLLTYYIHMHFPVYSYTFTRSSNSLDLHIRFGAIYCWSSIWRGLQTSWGPLNSLCSILVFSLYFIPVISCNFRYIGLITYSFPLFICYHAWLFIYYVAVLSCHHSDYIACSGCFRFSVYAWDIFFVNICHWLLSRIYVTDSPFSCILESGAWQFPLYNGVEQMEKDNPEIFETYWELMCHAYIYMVSTMIEGMWIV